MKLTTCLALGAVLLSAHALLAASCMAAFCGGVYLVATRVLQ